MPLAGEPPELNGSRSILRSTVANHNSQFELVAFLTGPDAGDPLKSGLLLFLQGTGFLVFGIDLKNDFQFLLGLFGPAQPFMDLVMFPV